MPQSKPLTSRQILAAHRLVEDRMTDEQIAAEIGLTTKQLGRWKRNPRFRALLKSLGKKYEAEIVQVGIATKRGRIDSLLDQFHRMLIIVDERASDPDMQTVPGGRSGLLVKQYKMIGVGKAAEKVTEYAFDSALHRELREVKKQVAIELGQFVEKLAPTSPDGEREFGEISDAERAARIEAIFATVEKRARVTEERTERPPQSEEPVM